MKTSNNDDLLLNAILTGLASEVRRELEKGFDLSFVLANDMTPLQAALQSCPEIGRLSVVEALLEFGANPLHTVQVYSGSGRRTPSTPFAHALNGGMAPELAAMLKSPFVDLLATDVVGNTLVHGMPPRPAKRTDPDLCVNSLIAVQHHFEQLIRPNHPELPVDHLWYTPNNMGMTPAMNAFAAPQTLLWMLNDPKVNLRSRLEDLDPQGRTILFRAASAGALDSVRLLISQGALIDVCDLSGVSMIDTVTAQQQSWSNIASSLPSNAARANRFEEVLSTLKAADASRNASAAVDAAILGSTRCAHSPGA